jgi:hypothetical protein
MTPQDGWDSLRERLNLDKSDVMGMVEFVEERGSTGSVNIADSPFSPQLGDMVIRGEEVRASPRGVSWLNSVGRIVPC